MTTNKHVLKIVTYAIFSFAMTASAQLIAQDKKPVNADTLLVPKIETNTSLLSMTFDEEKKIIDYVFLEPSIDKRIWRRHLKTNLQACIDNAIKLGSPSGNYKIRVKFLIEKDGTISKTKALDDVGFGLCDCAEKIMLTGPKWFPKVERGKTISSYQIQEITFIISDKKSEY
jgi:hypothetical protein